MSAAGVLWQGLADAERGLKHQYSAVLVVIKTSPSVLCLLLVPTG